MRFLTLVTAACFAPFSLSADISVLLDPFSLTAAANQTNINTDIPARQSGVLTGGTYTELMTNGAGFTNDAFIEKNSTNFGGSDALLLRTFHNTTSTQSAVRYSTNFGPQVVGKVWTVSYSGNIQRSTADMTDTWLALSLGDTLAHVGPNNTSTDLGFLIRGNGGWATWTDNTNIANGAAAALKSPDLYGATWTLVLTVDETVSPATASAVVSINAGATSNLGPWNLSWENSARYLELRLHNGGNSSGLGTIADARIDDLSVSLAEASYPSHRQRVAEPLAISNKKTPLVFSEIMYHPADRTDARNLEFVELYNTNPWPEDLTGWRLSDDVDYAFPVGTSIPARGFLVVAANPSDVQAVHGIAGVLGPFTGALSNEGGTLRLRRANNAIVLEATWNDGPDWPASADGPGHSLTLERASYGEGDPRAWAASSIIGGTPGRGDAPPTGELNNLKINEILAHSTVGTDFIELFNSSPNTADISGFWLSDDENLLGKFQLPTGTILPPRGRVSFDQTTLGFSLSAEGETLYLTNPAKTAVIDAVRYRGQLPDTASGRFPDGEGNFRRLSTSTPGAANSAPARGPVVINEIYFHPITNDSEDEWLELRNLTASPVSLDGWRLSDGVSFDFPAGSTIAANGYVVVAKNPVRVLANHPALSPAIVFGPFSGSLADSGEELVVGSPVTISTLLGPLTYHAPVDEVAYLDQSRWSQWADGGGSSLELADARDTSTPLWLDSDETTKAPWTLVSTTGVLDNVHSHASVVANRLDAMLLGEGEALLDEVQATPSGGSNQVSNGGFESGIGSWLVQGTHNRSVIENSGFAGTKSLRMIATARGDTATNRIRTPLATTLAVSSTATIAARVRWLRGSDEVLLRLWGGGLDVYGKLSVPKNLGTPGAANSRATANAAPAITEVSHQPALPVAGTPFQVFARVTDPSGLGAVNVRYRLDPATSVLTVAMNDSGTGGDLLAGDGVYTGTIPGQAAASLVAFTVSATDSASASSVFPPSGECLARVGDTLPSGAFGTYTMWMTSTTLTAWGNRLPKTNEPFPVTLLHNSARILYGTGAHFAVNAETTGTTPLTTISGYEIDLPPGEPLFGENDVTLDWPIRDTTNQREQLMHWMLEQMKLPTLHRRDVHVVVNGTKRTSATVLIHHEAHQPGGSYLDSNFPNDTDGQLYKTNNWEEFGDTGTRYTGPLNSLISFTTTGGAYKTARYRWCLRPRATSGDQNNYASVFDLVTAANSSGTSYVGNLSAVADMDQWMRNFAFADLCAFWDTFGNPGNKNAYLYKPVQSGWKILTNDMDVGLGGDINTNNPPSTSPLFPTIADTTIITMYQTPAFARHYWRAISDSLDTFFKSSAVTTRLTQRYNGYIANGVAVTSPFVASGSHPTITGGIPDWIDQRVTFLQSQLATVASTFAVSGAATVTTGVSPLSVTGSAPIKVKTITFNGLELPVTWTTTTTWVASVPVASGTNPLVIAAFDTNGVQTSSATKTVTFTGTPNWPALRINEWMADNSGAILDPADGKAQDWLELYNPTAASVSLTNWTLSDSTATFLIPSGYSVPARGRLLIWADEETFQNTGSGQLHAPFKLSSTGETLTLRAPDGTLVDTVTFGPQVENLSQGRIPDGGDTIDFLASPGAGSSNAGAVPLPTATAGSAVVDGIITIGVTATPGFTYQLQFVNELNGAAWTNLGTPVISINGTVTFTDSLGTETRRFYRVVRTP